MHRVSSFKTALLALIAAACAVAVASGEAKKIDIPAGDLETALTLLAKQSGVELMYSIEQIRGLKTQGVRGEYTAAQAAAKLLAGTKLTLKMHESGGILIMEAGAALSGDGRGGEGLTGPGVRVAQGEESSTNSGAGAGKQGDNTQGQASAGASGEKKEELEEFDMRGIPEILVTGKKGKGIMNVDVVRSEDDVQPYTILDSKQIQRSGATNVEEFLKEQLTMNATVETSARGSDRLLPRRL